MKCFWRIILFDVAGGEGVNDPKVATETGDLTDPARCRELLKGDVGSIFHLAGDARSELALLSSKLTILEN